MRFPDFIHTQKVRRQRKQRNTSIIAAASRRCRQSAAPTQPFVCPRWWLQRDPATNLPCPRMFWDFLSTTPESLHQVLILFSDRGTPATYR